MNERRSAIPVHEGGRASRIQVKGEKPETLLSTLPSQSPTIWLGQSRGHLNAFCCSMGLTESLRLEQMNEFSKLAPPLFFKYSFEIASKKAGAFCYPYLFFFTLF